MKKALVFGATGFVGSFLLEKLLEDPTYDQVIIVVRKPINKIHSKLKVLIGDLSTLPSLKEKLIADDLFIALGTTRKNTPDANEYYQIDHDYPILAAQLAKANGAKAIFVVTAVGANANSQFSYVRTKGEVERDLLALGFSQTHIFRPSMIMGSRKENRTLEKSLIKTWAVLNPLLAGPLSSYRGIEGEDIARAMIAAAKKPANEKAKIYEWKEMNALLN